LKDIISSKTCYSTDL